MKRFFYISDDLDDLAQIESELEASGISTPQIHVLSNNDAGVDERRLHQVQAFMKKDLVHSTMIGVVLGVITAAVVVLVSHLSGIPATVGWIPVVFLAIVAMGFVIWEAGLIGAHLPNVHFRRFEDALNAGKHIIFVETDRAQEDVLRRVLGGHATLESAGIETSHTKWLIMSQRSWKRFLDWAP
jgi:hypothetical protein